jgi:hypothetical protein
MIGQKMIRAWLQPLSLLQEHDVDSSAADLFRTIGLPEGG